MTLADELLTVLDDPTHMWSHAIKELCLDAQRLFLTLPLLPQPAPFNVLQTAYTSQDFSQTETFTDSLRALEDSFISVEVTNMSRTRISFRNPSLEDFSHAYLDRHPDWLAGLLKAPVFYQQVTTIFKLAMAEADSDGKGSPEYKYTGIRSWVHAHSERLLTLAIKLRNDNKARETFAEHRGRTIRFMSETPDPALRLSELVEIIRVFGPLRDTSARHGLLELAETALDPHSKKTAEAILEILKVGWRREILDNLVGADTASMLRNAILNKDAWKYSILHNLDGFLGIESYESLESWGNDYVGYASQIVRTMSTSDDEDAVYAAIQELQSIADFLDVDLYNEIQALEEYYSKFSISQDDYNEIRSPKDESALGDASRELDRIFETLLTSD